MSAASRYFTLEEARRLLKELLPQVSRLVELKEILNSRNYDIYRHRYFGGAGPNGTKHYPVELEELVGIMEQLSSMGVLVRSIEQGLIDFPCLREGNEEVYLCYKLGETDILFWHPIDEGFAGRKSTTQL